MFLEKHAPSPAPGDLVYIDQFIRGQWPPDGTRTFAPDSFKHIERLESKVLDYQHPALLLSVEIRHAYIRVIILHDGRLWWIPIAKTL